MTKEKFCEQLSERLNAKYGSLGYKTRIIKEGYTSEDRKELEFIKETNLKYFKNQEELLGGDIILLEKQGDSSVRQEIDYLIESFNDGGWEYVESIFDKNIELCGYSDVIRDEISDFDIMKDNIIVRVLNYELHKNELEDRVYRKIGDFVLSVNGLIFSNSKITSFFKISADFLKAWGITEDEVIEIGLENTRRLFPPRVYGVEYALKIKTITQGDGDYMNNSQNIRLGNLGEDTFVAYGTQNGATSFFYPGVKEKIAEMLGGEDYYVVFTSTEDFHVHKCSQNDAASLEKRLIDMNKYFPLGEMLTEKIYKYSVDTGELTEV